MRDIQCNNFIEDSAQGEDGVDCGGGCPLDCLSEGEGAPPGGGAPLSWMVALE